MKSPGTAPATVEAFQRELGELLRALRFYAADGGFAVGRLLSVQVVPLGQPRQPAYRLQAIIGPQDPKRAWLEGWLLSLSYARGGKIIHTAALTNHRGEASFPERVPALAECSLELRTLGFDATLDALQPFIEAEAAEAASNEREREVRLRVLEAGPAHESQETGSIAPNLAPDRGRGSRIEVPPELADSFIVDYRELLSSGGPVLKVRVGVRGSQPSPRWALLQGDTLVYPTVQRTRGGEYNLDLPPGDYVLYAEEHSVLRVRGAVRTRGASRPALGTRRRVQIKGTHRQYRVTDLKITADLVAEGSERSRFAITTRDASLANAAVVCSFGPAAQALVHLRCPEGAVWTGSVVLNAPFPLLARYVPHFEIQR